MLSQRPTTTGCTTCIVSTYKRLWDITNLPLSSKVMSPFVPDNPRLTAVGLEKMPTTARKFARALQLIAQRAGVGFILKAYPHFSDSANHAAVLCHVTDDDAVHLLSKQDVMKAQAALSIAFQRLGSRANPILSQLPPPLLLAVLKALPVAAARASVAGVSTAARAAFLNALDDELLVKTMTGSDFSFLPRDRSSRIGPSFAREMAARAGGPQQATSSTAASQPLATTINADSDTLLPIVPPAAEISQPSASHTPKPQPALVNNSGSSAPNTPSKTILEVSTTNPDPTSPIPHIITDAKASTPGTNTSSHNPISKPAQAPLDVHTTYSQPQSHVSDKKMTFKLPFDAKSFSFKDATNPFASDPTRKFNPPFRTSDLGVQSDEPDDAFLFGGPASATGGSDEWDMPPPNISPAKVRPAAKEEAIPSPRKPAVRQKSPPVTMEEVPDRDAPRPPRQPQNQPTGAKSTSVPAYVPSVATRTSSQPPTSSSSRQYSYARSASAQLVQTPPRTPTANNTSTSTPYSYSRPASAQLGEKAPGTLPALRPSATATPVFRPASGQPVPALTSSRPASQSPRVYSTIRSSTLSTAPVPPLSPTNSKPMPVGQQPVEKPSLSTPAGPPKPLQETALSQHARDAISKVLSFEEDEDEGEDDAMDDVPLSQLPVPAQAEVNQVDANGDVNMEDANAIVKMEDGAELAVLAPGELLPSLDEPDDLPEGWENLNLNQYYTAAEVERVIEDLKDEKWAKRRVERNPMALMPVVYPWMAEARGPGKFLLFTHRSLLADYESS